MRLLGLGDLPSLNNTVLNLVLASCYLIYPRSIGWRILAAVKDDCCKHFDLEALMIYVTWIRQKSVLGFSRKMISLGQLVRLQYFQRVQECRSIFGVSVLLLAVYLRKADSEGQI